MAERQAFADASFRSALVAALRRVGELCIVVCYAQAAGLKDWYLVGDWLRDKAAETLRRTGEVVLACRRKGDPKLHEVEATDDPHDVEAWFASEYEGERLVGPHPFRHDRDPGAAVFVAYNTGADDTIRPGAY